VGSLLAVKPREILMSLMLT